MRNLHLCIVILSSAYGLACSSSGEPGATHMTGATSVAQAQEKPPVAAPAPVVDANGTPGARLLGAAVVVQLRLAADDVVGARAAFGKVAATPVGAIQDAALRDRLVAAAKLGEKAKDLEAARLAFRTLSEALLSWLAVTPNPASVPLYVAHCPMAFDAGAKWVQATDKIANPYFGASMLTCGRIEATLKPGDKYAKK